MKVTSALQRNRFLRIVGNYNVSVKINGSIYRGDNRWVKRGGGERVAEFESKGGDSNSLFLFIRIYHDKLYLLACKFLRVMTILILKKKESPLYTIYITNNYYHQATILEILNKLF